MAGPLATPLVGECSAGERVSGGTLVRAAAGLLLQNVSQVASSLSITVHFLMSDCGDESWVCVYLYCLHLHLSGWN